MATKTHADITETSIRDDTEARHKKERRDLQAQIMQLKKTVPKGDKKRQKEMQLQVAQMEADFAKKCDLEVAEAAALEKENTAHIADTSLQEPDADVIMSPDAGDRPVLLKTASKAEKRRERKRLEDLERERRIAEQEKLSEDMPRLIEQRELEAKLTQLGMRIHDIAPDGNCLFGAISHQLQSRYGETKPVMEIRRQCADCLRKHREDFEPFLDESEDFDMYCMAIETDCARWGGQMELRAVSQELGLRISVYQAEGPTIEIGEEYDSSTKKKNRHLHLSYHRNLITTGEHYNSVVDDAAEDNLNSPDHVK